MMQAKSVGERIGELREDRDLTLKELAQICNMSISNLSKTEHDKRELKVSELLKIADYFNVNPLYLLKGNQKRDEDANLFIQKFVKQFGITSSEDFENDNNGVFSSNDFIFSMKGDYLILTAKEEFFELMKYLSREASINARRPPEEFERLVKRAIKRFSEQKKGSKKCSYFFLSKEQAKRLIDEKAEALRKGEDILAWLDQAAQILPENETT